MRGVLIDGPKFKALRREKGLTQEELASLSDCDTKTIRAAEQSRRIDLSTAKRIADAIEIPFLKIVQSLPQTGQARIEEVAVAWLDAFNTRDPDQVASLFAENGWLTVMTDAKLPGTGKFSGQEGVRRWCEICYGAMLTEQMSRSMFRIATVGNLVFACSNRLIGITAMDTQEQTAASVAYEFRVEEGKIASLCIYPDTQPIASILKEVDDFLRGEPC